MKYYFVFFVFRVCLSFKSPIDKLRKYRLKEESSKRQIPPDKLSNIEKEKLGNLGFIYDKEERKWKRERKKSLEKSNYIPPEDINLEQEWKSYIQDEFKGETYIFELPLNNKKKFVNKKCNSSESIELNQREEVQRLGFKYMNNKWTRGQPRNTPIKIQIKNKNRILTVNVKGDDKIKVVNRFNYIISQSQYETPSNIWDGALRIGRNKNTIFIWMAIQYKLWTLFTTHQLMLNDAWTSNFDYNLEFTKPIWLCFIIYSIATYNKNILWNESSGSLLNGALERSIVDGILTNYTIAPASFIKRKEMGIQHIILSSILRLISTFPRVAITQGYLQHIIHTNLVSFSQLENYMDIHQMNTQIIFESTIIMGIISVISDTFTFRWIRPAKTKNDEINSIIESIKMDDIYIEMLKKRKASLNKKQDKILQKYTDTLIETAIKDQLIFNNISNTWLIEYHDTTLKDVISKNITFNHNYFTYSLLMSDFLTGASSAFSYEITHNLFVPLMINMIGSYIEETPVVSFQNVKNKSINL